MKDPIRIIYSMCICAVLLVSSVVLATGKEGGNGGPVLDCTQGNRRYVLLWDFHQGDKRKIYHHFQFTQKSMNPDSDQAEKENEELIPLSTCTVISE